MKPIVQVSNWGNWEALDGETLRDGERLHVRWPDGSTSVETCRIAKGTLHHSDHGHHGEGPDDHAYVVLTERGAVATVRLRQHGILCERVPS